MTVLDAQALEDIAHGACVLGSGGGGALTEGLALARTLGPVTVVEASDVPDDAWMAVSAVIGSPTAAGEQSFTTVATAAYDALARARGVEFTHVLVGEIGAVNALIPMLPATSRGLPLVDASGSPRALPLLANCSFADTVPISPIALAGSGQEFTVTAPSAELADPLLRAVISSGLFADAAGFALWAMDGATMRLRALSGTLERARRVGELLRGPDPVAAVTAFLGARELFRGSRLTVHEQSGGGFDVGTVTLQAGAEQLTIYATDENLIAWRSGQSAPVAMAPDLICYLTADGVPFSNAEQDIGAITPDTEVVILGVPAAGLGFATPPVVASFAGVLAGMGYPGPYVAL